ncbi:hypothetical protein M407DRAFT_195338 [Tulasnella calospora MUT 4182]|uniref:Ribosomal protein L1 n=1 Tax=Tulasnella calospora MUT 4182 TaxID=1051891 RepID=A0A0C3L043_9AGAM|nr:hypothetical protein M407DRAFT_195338 [Tulasnella calospora MUT 4182]
MVIRKDALIDSHVSLKNTQAAIEAILKHASKQHELEEETEILGANEQRISLSIGKKRIRDIIRSDPRVIPLAHPIIDPRKTSICLIVKDPQREYKDLLEKENIKFIGRVVGVSKLKGKFRGFEERRQLLAAHGLFLVDDRVAALMPKLLGSMWFKTKKQPLPANMGAKDLKSHLERAINNTLMNENKGHTVTVKVGHTLQSPKHILDNILVALPVIAKHIDGGWNNVQNVYLTAPGASGKPGVSLPLWTCELGAGPGGRWDGGLSKPVAEEWGGLGTDEPDAPSEPAISASQDDSIHGEVVTSPEGQRNVRRFSESMGDPSMPPKKMAKTSKEAPTLEPLRSTASAYAIVYNSSSKPLNPAARSVKVNDVSIPSSSQASKATRPNLIGKKNRKPVDGKASKRSAKERVAGTPELLHLK